LPEVAQVVVELAQTNLVTMEETIMKPMFHKPTPLPDKPVQIPLILGAVVEVVEVANTVAKVVQAP
jgi:hypothetical protein